MGQLGSGVLLLVILASNTGCATAEMRREGIPARKSVVVGELLAIFPGLVVHGIGHRYAGDDEMASDLLEKEWKSLVYPFAWPFLGAAALSDTDNAHLVETFDEATGVTLVAPILFFGTWIYDMIETPGRIRAHNRMVDRMWEVKEVLDRSTFPAEIALGAVNPGDAYEIPLGVTREPEPGIELRYRLVPTAVPAELDTTLRPTPGAEMLLVLRVPPDAPPGRYAYDLMYGPPDVPLTERSIALEVEVLRPEVRLRFLQPSIVLEAEDTGWVRGLAEFVYETPLDGTCEMEALALVSQEALPEGSVSIEPAFDIRIEPRDGWDGVTLEANQTYRAEVAVFISPDLPSGAYSGFLKVVAAPQGQRPEEVRYPIDLTLRR